MFEECYELLNELSIETDRKFHINDFDNVLEIAIKTADPVETYIKILDLLGISVCSEVKNLKLTGQRD